MKQYNVVLNETKANDFLSSSPVRFNHFTSVTSFSMQSSISLTTKCFTQLLRASFSLRFNSFRIKYLSFVQNHKIDFGQFQVTWKMFDNSPPSLYIINS